MQWGVFGDGIMIKSDCMHVWSLYVADYYSIVVTSSNTDLVINLNIKNVPKTPLSKNGIAGFKKKRKSVSLKSKMGNSLDCN